MMPFEIWNPNPTVPIVANIPHSSAIIPAAQRNALLLSDPDLEEEHHAIVDWFTDELYRPIVEAGGAAIVSRISRIVLDTERFEDDAAEAMAKRGMGVIYERTTDQRLLRAPPAPAERASLLASFYHPYHAALTALCRSVLDRFGRCILLDCHSFPERSLPYERDRSLFRPEICIGTDERHSGEDLVSALEEVTGRFGWSCARNTPFAGTIVPLSLYGDPRLSSVMLEVNRGLYMDEAATERSTGFDTVRVWVSEIAAVVSRIAVKRSNK
ncbi:MAG: hypothetical protein RL417_434 [Pseudomonadota bacterium]|jgi:N-formylglutamate amidohydrolase